MNEVLNIVLTLNFILGVVITLGISVIFYKFKIKRIQKTHGKEEEERRQWHFDNNLGNHDNQLRFIEEASLEKVQILNGSEVKIFYAVEKYLNTLKHNYRVMAQVSLGEVIHTVKHCGDYNCLKCKENKKAYSSFNSKRFDLLIIDALGYPKLAIEYQGAGHYQGNSWKRDEVKRLVCLKANIDLLEIEPNENEKDYLQKIKTLLFQNYAYSYQNAYFPKSTVKSFNGTGYR